MGLDESDTHRLLELVRGGDRHAVDRLLRRHRDRLRRLVDARLDRAIAPRVDASDIVQEALIVASRRLDQYLADPTMPFGNWLRLLARDQMIDAHRRHRRAEKRSVDREQRAPDPRNGDAAPRPLTEQLVDSELTPAAAALRRELLQRFHAAVEEMNDDDRAILLMRHFEQMTNAQVAQALDLSPPAAGMRYLRALRRLQDRLHTRIGDDAADDSEDQ